MPGFQYKAVTADGEMVQGTLEGSDRQQVVEQLHALGHTPIRIDETAAPVSGSGGRRRRRRKRRLNEDQIANATRELATLLRAGLPSRDDEAPEDVRPRLTDDELASQIRAMIRWCRENDAEPVALVDEALLERLRREASERSERLELLRDQQRLVEAQRLEQRTRFDLEMMMEIGYCSGIENYSRYLSGRQPGEPPPTLFDYLPASALLVIDESHVTIPQLGGMYRGDRSRKENLVEYGFRLPSALDNRPLRFEEFRERARRIVHVSATPGEFELERGAVESPRRLEQVDAQQAGLDGHPRGVGRQRHAPGDAEVRLQGGVGGPPEPGPVDKRPPAVRVPARGGRLDPAVRPGGA